MGGKGDGTGDGNIMKLEKQITILKYTLLFTNVVLWMIGASVFALCLWLRLEPVLEDWIDSLEMQEFYIGVYILIFASIIMMVVSFVGCVSALQENSSTLLIYIGVQALSFICGCVGSAFLLNYSTKDSNVQRLIRESIRRLIINSHHEPSRQTLAVIQEEIGCCGADGPSDYLNLRQPIPTQCRDTVTGNPFFHGCVDEMTWFLEEKTGWIVGLVMVICMMHVCNAVMSIILMQALKKEEEESDAYRR